MKFGIFDHVEQRRDVPLDQQYLDRIELLVQADQGGIYGYHVAEHHHSPLSMAPCHAPYFTAIAAKTEQLRFGPLVYVLPLYHPVRLLEEASSLLRQMTWRSNVLTAHTRRIGRTLPSPCPAVGLGGQHRLGAHRVTEHFLGMPRLTRRVSHRAFWSDRLRRYGTTSCTTQQKARAIILSAHFSGVTSPTKRPRARWVSS